eukprot:TRINITY_DN169_c2_g1_i1.p1 TRINITY_DN169_c2_g1~~TRINITY_DN169_c2_g1_i1.p1  ORF type:complete len:139 (-),score=37.68 TRINITY_DN169_c2_g1_i1:59-475(-)
MSKCPTCSKTVYHAERVQAAGKDYHKICFKCFQCKKALAPGGFTENNNHLYCKSCYGSVIGLKGYGFGNSIDSHVSTGAATGGQGHGGSYSSAQVGGASSKPTPSASSGGSAGGAKFCSGCGTKSSGGKFCSSCGNAL